MTFQLTLNIIIIYLYWWNCWFY